MWDTKHHTANPLLYRGTGFGPGQRSKLRKATMPKFPLIVASISALLTFAASHPAPAQSQSNSSQSIPDAPQPQKKPVAKPPDKSDAEPPASDKPATKPAATKDDNPFPEDVSKQAAKA